MYKTYKILKFYVVNVSIKRVSLLLSLVFFCFCFGEMRHPVTLLHSTVDQNNLTVTRAFLVGCSIELKRLRRFRHEKTFKFSPLHFDIRHGR